MDTVHQSPRSATRSEVAFVYPKGSPMLVLYLGRNGYEKIVVMRHHLEEDAWSVWMIRTDDTSGRHTDFKRLKDAREWGARLADHCGLPLVDQTRTRN